MVGDAHDGVFVSSTAAGFCSKLQVLQGDDEVRAKGKEVVFYGYSYDVVWSRIPAWIICDFVWFCVFFFFSSEKKITTLPLTFVCKNFFYRTEVILEKVKYVYDFYKIDKNYFLSL